MTLTFDQIDLDRKFIPLHLSDDNQMVIGLDVDTMKKMLVPISIGARFEIE